MQVFELKQALVAVSLTLVSIPMFAAASGPGSPTPEIKIAIFVGPQTRDGFVDVDSGIIDSIKDIQAEFAKSSTFMLVRTDADATIVLAVVGRHLAGQSASIGTRIGTTTLSFPTYTRAIDTILRVGNYEKGITSEDETRDAWSYTAKKVVKDVTAWVEANRLALATKAATAP